MKLRVRNLLSLIVLVMGVTSALAQGVRVEAGTVAIDGKRVTDMIGIDQNLKKVLPLGLQFVDENGKTVMLNDYFGKRPVILVPQFYTCKSSCQLIVDGLLDAIVKMRKASPGKEYDIIFFTLLPTETVKDVKARREFILDVANDRGRHPEAKQGIHFLTGSEDSINALCSSIGYRYVWDPKANQVNHPAGIMVVTPQGLLSRYFYGVNYLPLELRDSLMLAANEKVGPVAQKVLFGCFQYNTVTGKYVLVAERLLEVSAQVFAGLVACAIIFMSIRYRQKPLVDNRHGGRNNA